MAKAVLTTPPWLATAQPPKAGDEDVDERVVAMISP
jgi:hypothetical protein